jgi:hypothetical protein
VKAQLHAEVELLGVATDHIAMTLHALIDLGVIGVLACQYDDCPYDRAFTPGRTRRGKNPRALVIDHIVSRRNNGSNLPENLQVLHHACNGYKAMAVDADRVQVKKQRGAAMRRRWKDPAYRAKMAAIHTGATRTAIQRANIKTGRWGGAPS